MLAEGEKEKTGRLHVITLEDNSKNSIWIFRNREVKMSRGDKKNKKKKRHICLNKNK